MEEHPRKAPEKPAGCNSGPSARGLLPLGEPKEPSWRTLGSKPTLRSTGSVHVLRIGHKLKDQVKAPRLVLKRPVDLPACGAQGSNGPDEGDSANGLGEVLGLELGGSPGPGADPRAPLRCSYSPAKLAPEAGALSQSPGQGLNQGYGLVTSTPPQETLLSTWHGCSASALGSHRSGHTPHRSVTNDAVICPVFQ